MLFVNKVSYLLRKGNKPVREARKMLICFIKIQNHENKSNQETMQLEQSSNPKRVKDSFHNLEQTSTEFEHDAQLHNIEVSTKSIEKQTVFLVKEPGSPYHIL